MKLLSTAALGAAMLALAGCGGGGGGNAPVVTGNAAPVAPVTPVRPVLPVLPAVTPPPAPTLPGILPPTDETPAAPVVAGGRLSGSAVAASGEALAHADIAVECHAGYGTTTALADGSYSASLPGAALPCMLQAFGDTQALYGLAAGTGAGTVVAHVSPLTELVMAAASHADPAVIFAGYPASGIGPADLAQGTATVLAALSASGIDLSGGSPLDGTLAAGAAAALASRLNTGASTLAALVAAFQDGSADLTRTLLVAPPVAACPQYRNGRYRIVFGSGRRGVLLADWASGAATVTTEGTADGGRIVFSPSDACRFTYTGTDGTVLDGAASLEGLIVLRDAARGVSGVGLPVQAYTVADTAGAWNTAEYRYDTATRTAVNAYGTLAVSPGGDITRSACGETATDCVASAYRPKVVADTTTGALALEGRLDAAGPGGEPVYLYRSPRRGKLLVIPLADGGILVATPAGNPAIFPAAGSKLVYYDALSAPGANGPVATFARVSASIVSAYAVTGSVVRQLPAGGLPQQFFYGQPRAGMVYRPQTETVNAQVVLAPVGTGLAVYGGAGAGGYLGFSALVE